jgi:hypothetical protein
MINPKTLNNRLEALRSEVIEALRALIEKNGKIEIEDDGDMFPYDGGDNLIAGAFIQDGDLRVILDDATSELTHIEIADLNLDDIVFLYDTLFHLVNPE